MANEASEFWKKGGQQRGELVSTNGNNEEEEDREIEEEGLKELRTSLTDEIKQLNQELKRTKSGVDTPLITNKLQFDRGEMKKLINWVESIKCKYHLLFSKNDSSAFHRGFLSENQQLLHQLEYDSKKIQEVLEAALAGAKPPTKEVAGWLIGAAIAGGSSGAIVGICGIDNLGEAAGVTLLIGLAVGCLISAGNTWRHYSNQCDKVKTSIENYKQITEKLTTYNRTATTPENGIELTVRQA